MKEAKADILTGTVLGVFAGISVADMNQIVQLLVGVSTLGLILIRIGKAKTDEKE